MSKSAASVVVRCPKSMIGRVIGKKGETLEALQVFSGAVIHIDQSCDPVQVKISGAQRNLFLATNMIMDIVDSRFRGFALLRQLSQTGSHGALPLSRLVYQPGYGLVPPQQMLGPLTAEALPTNRSVILMDSEGRKLLAVTNVDCKDDEQQPIAMPFSSSTVPSEWYANMLRTATDLQLVPSEVPDALLMHGSYMDAVPSYGYRVDPWQDNWALPTGARYGRMSNPMMAAVL